MPLLSQDEITNLIAEYPTHSDKWLLVAEAVRLAGERAAQICEDIYKQHKRSGKYPMDMGGLARECTTAIREAAK